MDTVAVSQPARIRTLWRSIRPHTRTPVVALGGLLYFAVSVGLMVPLRMKPVVNFNLFLTPFLAISLLFLLYRACTVSRESAAYVYAFFAGIFAWQLFGEVASITVPEGVVTRWSAVDLKPLSAAFYVIGAWIGLKILWFTRAIKGPVAVFGLTFLSIWTFELYMENYSLSVPVESMPLVANILLGVFGFATVLLLILGWRARTPERKTVLGVLLYVSLSVVLLAAGQWREPQRFYVEHEGENLNRRIEELQQERQALDRLHRLGLWSER